MSRWTRQEWLRDLDDEDLKIARDHIETWGFWSYVDSGSSRYDAQPCECDETIMGPIRNQRLRCPRWEHRRGVDDCIAANSQREQCWQATLPGLPFCAAHFDNAWKAMAAFVGTDRVRVAAQEAMFDVEREREAGLRDIRAQRDALALEVAQHRDARAILERGEERVYFFVVDEVVKIGRSRNPERRVKSFGGTIAPDGVDWRGGHLAGVIPGGAAVEGTLHARFARHRLVGEWFSLVPEVRDGITALLDEHSQATADVGPQASAV